MKKDWLWMPHAGHFICGNQCRFHLNTRVNDLIISTVGEFLPDSQVREILNKCRNKPPLPKGDANEYEYLRRFGFEDIGCNRKYETMVFKARRSKNKCCPYEIIVQKQLDFAGYNSAEDAMRGHYAMCKKWDSKK